MKYGYPHFIFALVIFTGGLLAGCKKQIRPGTDPVALTIANTIREIKNEYAPDPRTSICEIEARKSENGWVLTGETNLPEARSALISSLDARRISVQDSVVLLPQNPDSALAVVCVSVANLRAAPSYASELTTQATMGMPLRIYKKTGGWYRVQTPDSYIAWVNGSVIKRLTKKAMDSAAQATKVIFLDTYGFGYDAPVDNAARVSDLVAGSILRFIGRKSGYINVEYPDGRKGWIKEKAGLLYNEWINGLSQRGEDLIRTALKLRGIPYMWGGTSTKMMDCSGFTKTVFFLNGWVLPRDASQQSAAGILVDSTRHYENLEPGDLLFFGKKAQKNQGEKVIHVGLWMGGGRFIHASGTVHISSLVPGTPEYDEYNDRRYLKAKRLLGTNDPKVINLKKENIFITGE